MKTEKQRLEHFESKIKQGFLRLIVLQLLKQGKANHGYGLMKKIEEMSHGGWSPGANRIYPILKEFEKSNWVTVDEVEDDDRNKKHIVITDEGKVAIEKRLAITRRVLEPWIDLINETGLEDIVENSN